jgi:DNA-binding IscR family transcriptional regulator
MKREPNNLTLLDIYQAIEGPIEVSDCPLAYEICNFDRCLMGNVINKLTTEFRKFLEEQTLESYI